MAARVSAAGVAPCIRPRRTAIAANWASSNWSRFASRTASAHAAGLAARHRRNRATSRAESVGQGEVAGMAGPGRFNWTLDP